MADVDGLPQYPDEVLAMLAKLTAERDALKVENERLTREVNDTQADYEAANEESGLYHMQLRELREAYDLLHKRIEAYDETHAYLQELREAAEAVTREATNFWEGAQYDVSDSIAYVNNEALKRLAAVLAKVQR